jgi:hypothetical protein
MLKMEKCVNDRCDILCITIFTAKTNNNLVYLIWLVAFVIPVCLLLLQKHMMFQILNLYKEKNPTTVNEARSVLIIILNGESLIIWRKSCVIKMSASLQWLIIVTLTINRKGR